MRIIAFVTQAPAVNTILRDLGEPTSPPEAAPARAPPLCDQAPEPVPEWADSPAIAFHHSSLPGEQPDQELSCERTRQKVGKPRLFVDGQIAAIAAVNDLVLVTRNVSDFDLFQDLRVTDWTNAR